jgi:DNA-binding transcriptional ArsR family regulator
MSIRALNWAWSQRTGGPASKVVLMKLADYSNDTGVAFPSVARIALQCEMSERTVQRHLRALEANRLLTSEERRRADGSRTSNTYTLALPPVDDELQSGPDKMSPAPRARRTASGGGAKSATNDVQVGRQGGDAGDTLTTTQPSTNHHQPQPPADACGQLDLVPPPGLSGPEQVEAVRRVKRFGAALGQQLLDELAARMNIAQVRNPLRYLSTLAKVAAHGRFVPELALKVAADRAARRSRTPPQITDSRFKPGEGSQRP